MTDAILRADDLSVGIGDSAVLIDGWSAVVPAGVALLHGDSGVGKTTLLRALAAPWTLLRGTVQVAGRAFDGDRRGWAARVAWLDPADDAWDDVTLDAFADQWRQGHAAFDASAWAAHLIGFELTPHRAKRFEQCSTGTRRKAWIAASLASGAPLTLLDEPTAALDRPSIDYLWHCLEARRAAPGRLVLVASFDRPAALRDVPLLPLG